MNRRLVRWGSVAALAAVGIVSAGWFNQRLTRLLAQTPPTSMPGPIIEDPIGPYVGHSYVPAPSSNLTTPAVAASTFIVTYNGFSPEAQAAFQAAVDVWAAQITSPVPIRVTANWVVLGPNILGSAGPRFFERDFPGALLPNTWFPVALANKLSGTDLEPTTDDITANFSSVFDWYYGTDGNAGTKPDLMTVVLHELGHGLGFLGSMNGSGGTGSWGFGVVPTFPTLYDRFAINGASQFLIDTTIFPNPSTALGSQLAGSGGGIFFNGPNARIANGGGAARLYAPSPWLSGSSFSHLDELTFPRGNPDSLMTFQLGAGEAIHDPGPVTRGLFTDLGWTIAPSCSFALSATSVAVGPAVTTGSVNVLATTGCAWTATTNTSIANVTGGASGNGNGTVIYSVAVNKGAARSGTLTIAGRTFTISQSGRLISGDFDGDRHSDITVFRPSTGIWYVRNVITGLFEFYQWGLSGDIPVAGDYDGDGKIDSAVFRPSTSIWYVRQSSNGASAFLQWGITGDIPVSGDYDGDGKTDAAVFRPSTGIWYVRDLATNTASFYQWGLNGDIPVAGDYDGDGKTDVAVWRPSTGIWYIRQSSDGASAFLQWGLNGDIPVPGDYDGDGKADAAVFRPSTGIWYVRDLATNTALFYQWGLNGDVPVPGDFDGDGKTDVAVFRPSTSIWYVLNSSNGANAFYQWGITGDIPVLKGP